MSPARLKPICSDNAGSGYVSLPQMLRAGFLLSLIGAVVISAGVAIVASL
jgi:di/tricarboxylate transporter